MKTLQEIYEGVLAHLPKTTSLRYVDYRDFDSFEEEYTEILQQCLREHSTEKVYMELDKAYSEQRSEGEREYIKNALTEYLVSENEEDSFDDYLKILEASDLIFSLNEVIDERCSDGDILNEFIKKSSFVMFYELTDIEDLPTYGSSISDYKFCLKQIKKSLGIKLANKTHDAKIDMMLKQASYGGRFVVYFKSDEDLSYILSLSKEDSEKHDIRFYGSVTVAVIDNFNGSGDHCEIDGLDFKVPFNKNNLFFERETKYSYVYEVCGLYEDFCSWTNFQMIQRKDKNKKQPDDSSLNEKLEVEKEYDRVFKSGGCSLGDMNMKRHRNVTYINEFPCGNKCLDCSTFWID